jgi:hypothetical protein
MSRELWSLTAKFKGEVPMNIRDIVAMAEANEALSGGTREAVVRLFNAHDVVFGVWPDPTKPPGFDSNIIKGARRYREAIASNESFGTATALLCHDADHAQAVKEGFGERDLDA